MPTTPQQIFELAVHLMDEADPDSGTADRAENRDYKNRVLPILRVLQSQCYPYADTWRAHRPGRRPVCPPVEGFEAPLALDDGLCQGVLPYGLAAHLLLDENPEMASFFQQRYEELLNTLGRTLPMAFEDIRSPYGGIEGRELARW